MAKTKETSGNTHGLGQCELYLVGTMNSHLGAETRFSFIERSRRITAEPTWSSSTLSLSE